MTEPVTTETIDGHPVVAHRVRFKGRAEIDLERSKLVRDGDIVCWLVRTRCLPPEYHPIAPSSEERYRFNVQHVESALPLAGAVRESALVHLEHHDDGQSYLAFDNPGITVNGELIDQAARYDVERINKFIAEEDIYQEEGESGTDTVLRLLSQLIEHAERQTPQFVDETTSDLPGIGNDDLVQDEPVPARPVGPGPALDEIVPLGSSRAGESERVSLGSIYSGRRPDWMGPTR